MFAWRKLNVFSYYEKSFGSSPYCSKNSLNLEFNEKYLDLEIFQVWGGGGAAKRFFVITKNNQRFSSNISCLKNFSTESIDGKIGEFEEGGILEERESHGSCHKFLRLNQANIFFSTGNPLRRYFRLIQHSEYLITLPRFRIFPSLAFVSETTITIDLIFEISGPFFTIIIWRFTISTRLRGRLLEMAEVMSACARAMHVVELLYDAFCEQLFRGLLKLFASLV